MATLPKGQGVFLPPFKAWLASNIPAVYDNTMTYYEELVALIKYLQDIVVPAVNNNASALTTVSEAVEQLQKYVDEYFDNLDVQEEINNKLDQMAQDGTLENIIAKVLDTDETYYFHTVMASEYYRASDPLSGMQGGCILPDGTIFQCTGKKSNSDGKLIRFAQDGSLLNSADCDFGHCNSVTYNSKTQTVFITGDNPGGEFGYTIFEVDPYSLETVNTYDVSDSEFPALPYGIVYNEESDEYTFVNPWNLYSSTEALYMWKTDANFVVKETKTYNFKIRSTANLGRFGDYLAVCTLSNTSLLLFNPTTLEYIKQVDIHELVSDTWFITEIEWFNTVDDVVYLGFVPHSCTSPSWGGGTKVYAKCDLKNNYEELRMTNTEFKPAREHYYVDGTVTYNPLRDGSRSAPFRNIYEALNASLRQNGVTGTVNIDVEESANTFAPIFSVNKHYYINGLNNTTINCLSNIYVSSGCDVTVYQDVVLQGNNTTENPLNLGGANIQVRGSLHARSITLSTTEKISIATATTGLVDLIIQDDGADLSKNQGVIRNYRRGYTFLQNQIVFPSLPNYTSRILGLTFLVDEVNSKYSWGFYSKHFLATVRFRVANFDFEQNLPIEYGVYNNFIFPYLDGNKVQQNVQVKYTTDNTLQIIDSSGTITNKRVKITTL